jgi:hypothetical protein
MRDLGECKVAVKRHELGTKSWPDNLILSDVAIKAVVDQAQTELIAARFHWTRCVTRASPEKRPGSKIGKGKE